MEPVETALKTALTLYHVHSNEIGEFMTQGRLKSFREGEWSKHSSYPNGNFLEFLYRICVYRHNIFF